MGIAATDTAVVSYGTSAARNFMVDRTRAQESALIGGLGKNDFLKLLVAQLRNQDPMRPMEDREFIAQLAQLNMVEQMMTLNQNLSELMALDAVAQAAALVGKSIEAQPNGGGLISGVVQAVTIEDGRPVLIVNSQRIALADVKSLTSAER